MMQLVSDTSLIVDLEDFGVE